MLPTSILLLATAISITAAAPVDSVLESRICGKVLLPTQLIQLKAAAPNTAFPNTALTDKSVLISQDINSAGRPTNKVNELIAFTGPVGGYGCTLGITFPAGYPFTQNSGAPPTLNIYTVRTPLPASPTYNNVNNIGPLFGTVTVQAGQSTIINSQTCPSTGQGGLAFVFTYPDWVVQQGRIGWNGSKAGENVRGVYLSYNC